MVVLYVSTVDLTEAPHLTEFKLVPHVQNDSDHSAPRGHSLRANRALFGKFDGLFRGKLVRAVYDSGWTVTEYPGVVSMTTAETAEAEFVWFGGRAHTYTDRFGGLETALVAAGYTVGPGFSSGFSEGFDRVA